MFDCILFFVCCKGEGIEMGNQGVDVGVVSVGFEAELVLEGDGKGKNHVDGGYFGEEIFFGVVGSLVNVYPDVAGEVAGLYGEGGPGLAAVGVSLVGGCAAE